jgi:uncharacterized membrane protein
LRPGSVNNLTLPDGVVSTPDRADVVMRIEKGMSKGIFRDPRPSLSAQGELRRMTVVIVPVACSDGMSDRSYGLDVTLIRDAGGEPEMLTGCCLIAPR